MAGRLIHIRNEVKVLERYLLKNIIILILALVNICLLGSLAMRQSSATDARRQGSVFFLLKQIQLCL